MDVEEQIKVFREFIEQNYLPQLLEAVRKGQNYLVLDFSELIKFNTEITEEILESPEELLKAAELTIKEFDLPQKVTKFNVRLKNLPESQKIRISDIRSKHLNKFIWSEGIVRQKSDVRPHVTAAKFECPSCGNILNILQLDKKYKEPSRCGCGRKGKFKEISKELVDGQGLVLEESPDDLDGSQPKRINVFLKDDLVSPFSEKRTSPGSRVKLCGWVVEVPITLKTGGQATKYDLIIEANNIEPIEDDFTELNITEKEEEQIKEIAKSPNVISNLGKSIAPSIYGHDKIKEALALQLAGGCRKVRPDGVTTRGDIHMLLIGDPGSGKSQILKRIFKVAPRSRFTSGKGASAAGLCVAPDSLVLTNPNGINKIQDLVEEQLKDNQTEYAEGIYKNVSQISPKKAWSFDNNLKLQSKPIENFWRIKSPEYLYTITLRSGKKITLTENTQLFHADKGQLEWKKSSELKLKDYVATARRLTEKTEKEFSLFNLVEQNPVVHGVKTKIRKLLQKLGPKYTKRELAEKIGRHENNLYSFWVREDLVGNIRLKEYLKLLELADEKADENLVLSLYNGKKFCLPAAVTSDFMYFLGLVAGDGDLSHHNNNFGIRLSNASTQLIKTFVELVKKLFNQECNITLGNEKRPTSARFNNKIVFRIINKFGIPSSPKSDRIDPTNHLLGLPNEKIAAFLSGLYDTDGSINYRKQKNGHIELTTASKSLAEKVQLVLLRFEIVSYLRNRLPRPGKIKSKLKQYRLLIYGVENLEKFESKIGFYKIEKKDKLSKCVQAVKHRNTNVDIIPETNLLLKNLLIDNGLTTRKAFGYKTGNYTSLTRPKNVSRNYLGELVNKFSWKKNINLEKLKKLANSDLLWEEITKIEKEKSPYEYVYDLTIQDSHSFLVNGILVHNTASVVKDEFLGGWSLEAGTLVLANRGFAIIDEMDKMNKDDRSALHEALEQQSYHPETEIRLGDGSVDKIGKLVDEAMEKNAEKVIAGKNCEILDYKPGLLTTDFTKIYPTKASRISRHLAPDKFFEIEFQNGRRIKVTPEHPLFVYGSELKEVPADKIKSGDLCPGPRFLPAVEKEIKLETVSLSKYHKEIRFPEKIDPALGKLIGYLVTEGHSYHQPSNHYAEIGVSNTDPEIVEEVKSLMKDIFKTKINVNLALAQNRKKATKNLTTIRCCSEPLYYFFKANFKELLEKATVKRIPNLIRTSSIAVKTALLQSAFKGDGFIDSERFGYSTSSPGLAKDYQDLLMELRIYSYLACSKQRGNMNAPAYKVVISGAESMESFVMKIATKSDPRLRRLKQLAERSRHKNNDWDVFPLETGKRLKNILAELRLDDGYFYNIIKSENNIHRKTLEDYIQKINKKMNKCETIISESDSSRKMRRECNLQVEELCKEFKVSAGTIYNLEKKKSDRLTAFIREKSGLKINRLKNEINQLNNLINSDLRFFKVKSVKEIKNKDVKWVYDLTVEPNKNFISEGLILHNSVSISKANIQATLRCETTVLAAANPKFGRFDPYGIVAEQIDLPPTLINRFDLIFPIKDLPNREKDEETATFILNLHKDPESAVSEIDTTLLKKYFAYIRQKINPKMTDAAIEELKDYYITMRNSGTSEESGMKSIPITARQLEALVRLAEAAAKVRLAKTVTKKDAQKAIELIDYCLNQIAKDKDTGKIDIDRISSTVSASQRSGIGLLKEIISSLEEQMGTKMIPVDNIIEAAKEKNLSKEQVEDIFGKLKRSGDIFEPKRGFIQRL